MTRKSVTFFAALFLMAAMTACFTGTKNEKSDNEKEVFVLSDSLINLYREQGRFIVKSSFQALSTQLTGAIQTGGVPYAVSFCNIEAVPIMDSMTAEFNVNIKRVSEKNRNPENSPDAFEQMILDLFDQNLKNSGKVNDTVLLDANNTLVYAAPILMAQPCLQCHGVIGTDISDKNNSIIKKLYPADKASGFAQGDLRGIWRIRFEQIEN
ncbi:MAG: DUF3365 domain-containing protein [Bacteroidales bacterium]|nr:DUF3365 domain-containing protein [Bacteroidales bacterium]